MIPLIAAAGTLDLAGKVAMAATTLAKAISGKDTKDTGNGNTTVSFADLVASHGGAPRQDGAWRTLSDAVHSKGHGKSKTIDQIA